MILIIDYGSQYTHLLSSTIRGLGYDTQICYDDDDIANFPGKEAIILSGGPYSVYEDNAPTLHPSILNSKLPIFAICYGHQLLQQVLSGKVESSSTKEYGIASLQKSCNHALVTGLEESEQMWMSHGDEVTELAPGFQVIATTKDCKYALIGNDELRYYGCQFHPEVSHSIHGKTLLKNFLEHICGLPANRTMQDYIPKISQSILDKVGQRKVCMLVSGGVDSSVAYTLLCRVLGEDRCYGFLIDTGTMRKGEVAMVAQTMQEQGFAHFQVIDAKQQFIDALAGVYEPEAKRKIIGNMFLQVQQETLTALGLDDDTRLLGQGTIYPDIIESQGSRHASLIKTHHNRVPAIQRLIEQGKVIEPLSHLYKHEVRSLGLALGLPSAMIERHPFPGPGLAIRMLCSPEQTPSWTYTKQQFDTGFSGFLLPIQSVGAQGDARSYKHPMLLEGIYTPGILQELSVSITNSIPDCNRVIFLVAQQDDFSISDAVLHPARYVTASRIALLQEVDALVTDWMQEFGYQSTIWQMPVVLIPRGVKGETIILRPIQSRDGMTAEVVYIDEKDLKMLVDRILTVSGIDCVCYDITNKPPSTIERE